jgi:hypothetical protein
MEVATDIGLWLAGPLAELRYRKLRLLGLPLSLPSYQAAWDLVQVMQDVGALETGDRSAKVYLLRRQRAVQKFLWRPKIWRAVTAVADALLRHHTLDGEPLDALLNATYGMRRAPQWVRVYNAKFRALYALPAQVPENAEHRGIASERARNGHTYEA